MNEIALHVEALEGVPLKVGEGAAVALDAGGDFYAIGTPYFDGEYEVTPTGYAQTLEIKEKRARDNITIKPIPSNYGLITYNGSVITVS